MAKHHHVDEKQEGEQKRKIESGLEDVLMDPYITLGLSRQATLEEIKKAYFAGVRNYPPEREPEMFKRIRTAYDALRTPEVKAATDLFLLHPPVSYRTYKRAPAFSSTVQPEDWWAVARAYSDLVRADFRDDFRNIKP